MKKIIAMVLLFSFAISLSACGATSSEPSVGDQMYEKYKTIIDNLEAEDYEKALDEISNMMPEPEINEVTITPENFLDYYEIVYWPIDGEKDASGMWTSLSINTSSFYFKLKDQFVDKVEEEDSHCEVGIVGSHDLKRLESVDFSTGRYVLSEETYDDIKQTVWEQFKAYGNPETFSVTAEGVREIYPFLNDFLTGNTIWYHWGNWSFDRLSPDVVDNEIYVSVIGDLEIVRAEGTLFLRN